MHFRSYLLTSYKQLHKHYCFIIYTQLQAFHRNVSEFPEFSEFVRIHKIPHTSVSPVEKSGDSDLFCEGARGAAYTGWPADNDP